MQHGGHGVGQVLQVVETVHAVVAPGTSAYAGMHACKVSRQVLQVVAPVLPASALNSSVAPGTRKAGRMQTQCADRASNGDSRHNVVNSAGRERQLVRPRKQHVGWRRLC